MRTVRKWSAMQKPIGCKQPHRHMANCGTTRFGPSLIYGGQFGMCFFIKVWNNSVIVSELLGRSSWFFLSFICGLFCFTTVPISFFFFFSLILNGFILSLFQMFPDIIWDCLGVCSKSSHNVDIICNILMCIFVQLLTSIFWLRVFYKIRHIVDRNLSRHDKRVVRDEFFQ